MKANQVDQLKKDLEQTVDSLGKPIDPGILETVLYLRALGFPTSASCEGHVNWSLVAPWVEIESPAAQPKGFYDHKKSRDLAERQLQQYIVKLNRLLVSFYQVKKPAYNLLLIVEKSGWQLRLHSIGLDILQATSTNRQIELLPQYQKEMQRFTRYLGKLVHSNRYK